MLLMALCMISIVSGGIGATYNRNLVLDYGTNGISFMDDVRVYGDRLSGIFYLSDNAPGFNFELRME